MHSSKTHALFCLKTLYIICLSLRTGASIVITGDSKRNFMNVICCPEDNVLVRTSTEVLLEWKDFPASMLGTRRENDREKSRSRTGRSFPILTQCWVNVF